MTIGSLPSLNNLAHNAYQKAELKLESHAQKLNPSDDSDNLVENVISISTAEKDAKLAIKLLDIDSSLKKEILASLVPIGQNINVIV